MILERDFRIGFITIYIIASCVVREIFREVKIR